MKRIVQLAVMLAFVSGISACGGGGGTETALLPTSQSTLLPSSPLPTPTSVADYGTGFSIAETSEASFVLTDKNPRHLDVNDSFTLSNDEQIWVFTAAQYSVNVYALDSVNAQLFIDGKAFRGFLLCGKEGDTGMCFPSLPAGKYWIGSMPSQTLFSTYSNPVYHEVSSNHVLAKWRKAGNVTLIGSGKLGAWSSKSFNIPTGDRRAYIETEGYGGEFIVMTAAQYSGFLAAYANGYTGGGYNYTYACGGKSGGPATEIECEMKLSEGNYYLVYLNTGASWAGGAANIEFYLPL